MRRLYGESAPRRCGSPWGALTYDGFSPRQRGDGSVGKPRGSQRGQLAYLLSALVLAPYLGAIGGVVLVVAGLAQGHHVGLRIAMVL